MQARFIARRFLRAGVTFLIVVSLTFAIIRLMPGGPMDYLRAQLIEQGTGNTGDIDRLVRLYSSVNPNQPIEQQYVDYIVGLFNGDLGVSTWYDEPVADILAQALPWTVFVTLTALLFNYLSGVVLGSVMAYDEGSRFDFVNTIVIVVSRGIPFYVVAIMLQFVLAYQFGWFPTGGQMNPNTEAGLNYSFIAGVLKYATLPILSLILAGFGGPALNMRSNSIRVLESDFIQVARLRGLRPLRIATLYVGRNAILPLYTGFLMALGTVFGGAIILENIFRYPGIGYYMFQAVSARDYPLMMGAFLLTTVAILIGLTIADITYGWIDPRAATGGENEQY